jgi:hypothetical protein
VVRKKETKNILDMVPQRAYEWEEDEKKGIVIVKMPRFKSRLGKKFCSTIKKDQTYNVKLDEKNSFIWKLCDGKRSVKEIAKSVLDKYEEDVEPVYQRVGELFNIMESNGLITYKKKKDDLGDAGGRLDGDD